MASDACRYLCRYIASHPYIVLGIRRIVESLENRRKLGDIVAETAAAAFACSAGAEELLG